VCVLWGFLNALRAYMKVVKQNGGGFSFVYSPLCLTFLFSPFRSGLDSNIYGDISCLSEL